MGRGDGRVDERKRAEGREGKERKKNEGHYRESRERIQSIYHRHRSYGKNSPWRVKMFMFSRSISSAHGAMQEI